SFTYNAVGQIRETRSFYANGTTRSLGKDAEGMPRGTINISGWLTGAEQMQYDRDGRMLSQLTKNRTTTNWGQYADDYEGEGTGPNQRTDLTVLADKNLLENTYAGGASGYDAAGRLGTYRFTEFGKYVHTYSSTFEGWSSYQEKTVHGVSSNTNYRTTTNTLTYDGMARLISQREHTNYQSVDDRIRYYAYNGDARVQMRRSGTLNSSQQFVQATATDGSKDNVLFVHAGGQQQAELKQGGQTRMWNGGMYDTKQLQSLGGTGNYSAGGGKVTVQAGENLQSLAQRIYGTSQRWYVLADANGLSDPNQELIEGTQLNAPNVNVSSNDAGTFKPYNAGDAIGSTSPSLPYITPPPKQQCNALAMIIIVIIVIIVTVYTAGAAAGAMGVTGTAAGGGAATTAAVGGSVLAGGGAATGVALGATAGSFAAANMGLAIAASAFAGGVVGSIAGQAVGNMLGVRDGFSLREAFASGLTSMAGAGIGRMLGTASATNAMRFAGEPGKAAASAVLNGLSSYAANKIAGVEATFSWRNIAASAVAAAVTSVVAPKISGALGFNMSTEAGQFGADLTGGLVGGVVGLHTRRAFGFDDPVNYGQIVADAFGNTVANYLVGAHRQQALAQQVTDRRQQFVDQLTQEQGVAAGQSAEAMLHQLPLTLDEQAVRSLIVDRLALTEESPIEQFREVTGRYLRMAQLDGKNITDEEYDQTMADLFRRGTVTVLDLEYEGPVGGDQVDEFASLGPTPYEQALNEQWLREETNPAFGHQLIDHGLQGVGSTVLRVGEAIESRPWLKWSLVGIEVAAGPALYGARQFIAATPVGRAIERAQEAIVERSAERFVSNPGYESNDATRGGVGVMVALTLAAGGVAGLLRKLPAVQRTLTGIEARMSQLRYRHFPSSRVMDLDDFRSRFGSTFKSAREAEIGWDWYQRAATGSGTLVIGRQVDTGAAATRGFERLNITPATDWTPQINDAWLQGAIDAGRPVRLVSPLARSTLRNPPGSAFPDTIFRRELHQLRASGYTIQNGWAVPPRRR
ncbi:MAG: LysM peptidoglycan-binding domain-containing protein, partial [Lysobacter sp.]